MASPSSVPRQRVFTDKNLAALLVGGTLAVGLLVLFGPWWPARDLSAIFTPELVEMLQMADSTALRRAHQLTLALLALAALAGLWLRARRPQWLRGPAAAAIAQRLHRISRPGPLLFMLASGAILLVAPDRTALAYGLLLVPISLIVRYVRPSLLNRAGWVALLIYVPVLMLPGFFLGPSVWRADPIWLEMHYGATIGVGEQLAAGMRLYGEIRHHYGLLLSMASGIVERQVAPLSAGQYYRSVQVLNLIFALLAGMAYWRWRPGNAVKVLVPVMLVLPWIHSLHLSLSFPNQSAWRFIGLPVGVLLLLTLGRARSERMPLLLGSVAGVALLFNLETGIALSCGLLIFQIARVGPAPIATWPGRAAGFALGLAAVVLVVLLIYRVGLGAWSIPNSLPELLGSIFSFSAGFGGYTLSGEPLALVIFLHASYVVVYGALRWRFGALRFASAFRVAIATTLLVWFAYYANRPVFWNLWSFLFLYGFLLADSVDLRLLRWNGANVRRLRISAGVIVVALVIIPAGVKLNRDAAAEYRVEAAKLVWALRLAAKCARLNLQPSTSACFSGAVESAPMLSGIPLRDDLAALIKEKVDYLQAQPDRNELVYFTVNSYFVPRLTGLYERRLGYRDAFAETLTNRQMDELVAKLLAVAPPRILFDAPDSLVFRDFSTEYHRRFYERLRGRLESEYRPTETEHGWLVLTPIARAAQ